MLKLETKIKPSMQTFGYDRPAKRRQVSFDANVEFGKGVLLADGIVNKFKVSEGVVYLIDKWEKDIFKMSRNGVSMEDWATYFYLLYLFCESNHVKTTKSLKFDANREFLPFMEVWRFHSVRNGKIYVLDDSLTSKLMDALNLNSSCRSQLKLLETKLLRDIYAGESVEDLIPQLKTFCRRHSNTGYYDPKNSLDDIFSSWYDNTVNSTLPSINWIDF